MGAIAQDTLYNFLIVLSCKLGRIFVAISQVNLSVFSINS